MEKLVVKELDQAIIDSRLTDGMAEIGPNEVFDISLFDILPSTVIALNVNGIMYYTIISLNDGDGILYDKNEKKIILKGMHVQSSDAISLVYNISVPVLTTHTVSIPVLIEAEEGDKTGNYVLDPSTYSESFNIHPLGINDVLGVNINGLYYMHSRYMSYNPDTKILMIHSLPITLNDKVNILAEKYK